MRYGALLRHRDFRHLWIGQIASLLGDWFNLIASAALVGSLTQSGFAVGGLFIVRMLAPFVISPLAGVAADRFDRRRILILSDLARAGIVLCFLLVRRPEDVWLLYVLTALQLGTGAFFFPARNALLPEVVPAAGLGTANALTSATWSVMLALGAALGGLAAGYLGLYAAFLIDAATFVVSAWCIARLGPRPRPPSGKTLKAALDQYRAGLGHLRRHRDTLGLVLHKAAIGLYSGGLDVLLVAIARDVFPIGEGGSIALGLVFGVAGIGSGLGPIAARYFTGDRDLPLRRSILLGYALGTTGLLLMAPLGSFALLLAGALLRSAGGGIVWVFSTQLLLQTVPDHVRGRVFASEFALFTLMSALAAAAVGWVLDTDLSLSTLLVCLAALPLAPAAGWAWWLWQYKRD